MIHAEFVTNVLLVGTREHGIGLLFGKICNGFHLGSWYGTVQLVGDAKMMMSSSRRRRRDSRCDCRAGGHERCQEEVSTISTSSHQQGRSINMMPYASFSVTFLKMIQPYRTGTLSYLSIYLNIYGARCAVSLHVPNFPHFSTQNFKHFPCPHKTRHIDTKGTQATSASSMAPLPVCNQFNGPSKQDS